LLGNPQATAQPLHFELHRVSYLVHRLAETLGNLGRREAVEIRELQRIFRAGWNGAGTEAFDSPLARDGNEPGGLATTRRLESMRVLARIGESLFEGLLRTLWNSDDAQ